MDKDTFKSNIKTVKELILDEQKLVTYISLSRELCIHVNEAKSLLKHFVQDVRQNQPKTDIYVCYLISGLLNNNNACTTVCSESDLDDFKKTLKITFYEHVYCVSRGMQSVDNVALTAINKFEDFSLCSGLIRANSCIKRSDDELGNLKSSRNNTIAESVTSNATKKKVAEKPGDIIRNGQPDDKKVNEIKSEPVSKAKTPSPKKNLFTTNNKTSPKKNGTKPVGKGIAGFFNKANGETNKTKNVKVKEEKQVETVKKEVEKEAVVKVEPVSDKDDSVTNEKAEHMDKSKNKDKDGSVSSQKAETINKSKNKTKSSSLKQIKKNAKVDKKRKRVLHVSDSESDTEANDPFAEDENKMEVDGDSEDEIPPTPSANTVKITSGIVNPKKRRKIVDKTYTDEDGYILTRKEEVYESCSDNEEEKKTNSKQEKENIAQVTQVKSEISPKENGKAKKKKVSPPQKGKQQTLTNFFKKV